MNCNWASVVSSSSGMAYATSAVPSRCGVLLCLLGRLRERSRAVHRDLCECHGYPTHGALHPMCSGSVQGQCEHCTLCGLRQWTVRCGSSGALCEVRGYAGRPGHQLCYCLLGLHCGAVRAKPRIYNLQRVSERVSHEHPWQRWCCFMRCLHAWAVLQLARRGLPILWPRLHHRHAVCNLRHDVY